jgi:sirohydrochlorin ferrochelatase
MKTVIILLGHGSMAEGGNVALRDIAAMVSETTGSEVLHSYLQFVKPTLVDAFEQAVHDGAGRIVIMPYFLYMGEHVSSDIPEVVDQLKGKHPSVEVVITDHLGAHKKLAEIVVERLSGYTG